MKITIWQPKVPATVDDMKSDFAHKLGAFRAATGRPERFVMRCACAIHDREFAVVYERTDLTRPFIITGIYRDGEGDSAGGTRGDADAARRRTLAASEVDHTGWRCPFCHQERQINCNGCHMAVCGGKTRSYPGTGDIFTCRDSCGARGTLIECSTVTGIEPKRMSSGSKPMSERLPASGTEAQRLGSTKAPRC